MASFIVGFIVFMTLFLFFVFSYKANKSTPVPEGIDTSHACNGCKAGCKFRI